MQIAEGTLLRTTALGENLQVKCRFSFWLSTGAAVTWVSSRVLSELSVGRSFSPICSLHQFPLVVRLAHRSMTVRPQPVPIMISCAGPRHRARPV